MATVLRSKSFQKNLLFSVGGIFLLFAVCFSIYQYQREKEYKIDILHSRLQMYNYEMVQELGENGILNDSLFAAYSQTHNISQMRLTVIDLNGRVLQDNGCSELESLTNHLKRVEVQEALKKGSGYDIMRTSESTHETYFYSATKFNDIVIRTAVPYSAELTQSLKADHTFIYFTIALTFLLGLVLFWNTRQISRHIEYLSEFAIKAEKGEELDHKLESKLPDDELGEISHTIITLFWKLKHSEEDKQRIKRQLTQNAAHELKTPAASIHGFLESILDHPDMPADKRQHFLERCYAQSERMSKLLFDMSALTKLDEMGSRENSKEEFSEVDVLSVINNVLCDTDLQLKKKGISAIIEAPQKIKITADSSLIYSIFRNITDNVIAYATDASILKIACQEKSIDGKDYYEFSISDNGPGVDLQHREHLFERFYRVDKGRSRKLGGTGLGLAIVKNAVAVHGGTVNAEATPGGGLTIRFTLLVK